MKVDIIRADSWLELEIKVNDCLRNISADKIHDIKFCLETNHPAYSIEYDYAVIIYK